VNYTTNQVLAMVADGRLVLSSLPSRRLSVSQVVIEVNNRAGIDVLTLPSGYENDELLDTLLHSFTLPEYALRVSTSEKVARNRAVIAFFTFIDGNRYPNNLGDCLPAHCFVDWLEHLKRTTTPISTWMWMSLLLKILSRTLEKRFGKTAHWPAKQKAAWQILKANIPAKANYEKTPPLGRYLNIPESKYSNHELKMGLRYGVIWLLKRLHAQRTAFVAQPEIVDALAALHGSTLREVEIAFQGEGRLRGRCKPRKDRPDIWERLAQVLPAAWRVIQADPLLIEWQFYCWTKLRPALVTDTNGAAQPFSADIQQMLLSRCINSDGCIRCNPLGLGANDTAWQALKHWLGPAGSLRIPEPCCWGKDWLVHTELERLLMVWLLASERAQKSGIERLTFSGVQISGDKAPSLQISTLKLRRASNPSAKSNRTDVETQIYKHRDPPFGVYRDWLTLEQEAYTNLSGYNLARHFLHGSTAPLRGVIVGDIKRAISNALLPLELLSVPGTVWHDTFLAETSSEGQRIAQAFISILHNRVIQKRTNPTLAVTLPIGPIGQSLVVEQELENNQRAHTAVFEAQVMGHNETTGRNIYKDGFAKLGISEIIEPVRAFARKVGDGKIMLAENMARRLTEASRQITLVELEELSGIESTSSHQTSLLATLDSQNKLTIAGEILQGDETLIVQTEMTAGMMWGYITHLEAALPDLMISDRDETTLKHLAQLIHLHQTFRRFDEALQLAGRQLAAETNFPFPPLT